MKLVSYLHQGVASWGALRDGGIVDLRSVTGLPALADFLGSAQFAGREALVRQASVTLAVEEVQWLPVIPQPEKIFCTVRNYLDHHQETVSTGIAVQLTEMPPIFVRTWRSQCAHEGPIVRPRVSDSLDWEGELAVVIGQGGRDIAEADAYAHVAGYACYNDASVREWQFHAKQIAAGKNFESTGAFGPWLVTADEIAPGRSLRLQTRLNGEVVQNSETKFMIFGIPRLERLTIPCHRASGALRLVAHGSKQEHGDRRCAVQENCPVAAGRDAVRQGRASPPER
jgi:2-keto-4-pentenoate hydratase/2-oxohepta-3-ene-1,7-dioic acid hydratase in catechol pathway